MTRSPIYFVGFCLIVASCQDRPDSRKQDLHQDHRVFGVNKLELHADHQLLSGSVWPFGVEELDFVAGKDGGKSASGLVPVKAKHGADIKIGNLLTWNIDHRQMGVGGDTSWGRPVHDKYTIPARVYRYSFILIPNKYP